MLRCRSTIPGTIILKPILRKGNVIITLRYCFYFYVSFCVLFISLSIMYKQRLFCLVTHV